MTNEPSETDHIAAARERKEALAQAFDGRTVWYQEKYILVHARAEVTTSDWGVNVRLANDDGYAVFHGRPISLSGRWDVLIVGEGRMGAQYAGWSLTTWHGRPTQGPHPTPQRAPPHERLSKAEPPAPRHGRKPDDVGCKGGHDRIQDP
jgi:hypothetical protein